MYNGITDYIRKNMNGNCGDFMITATEMSERKEGCIAVCIHPHGVNGDTADFLIHPDGSEEFTELI